MTGDRIFYESVNFKLLTETSIWISREYKLSEVGDESVERERRKSCQ